MAITLSALLSLKGKNAAEKKRRKTPSGKTASNVGRVERGERDGLRRQTCDNNRKEEKATHRVEKGGGHSQELRWLGPGQNTGRWQRSCA
ncbi:hypothetical protein EYF80_009450 [Liparis tanakae]|uniref:Uncharacterized protein n=1 Tax=Liparis tanakae TaxID=230148 RepID=A0A4Z2IRE5_9TELE|nr:hypothetical protein EYF80_009450 [Liparis tanakae]